MTGVATLLRPGSLGSRWELGWFWIGFWPLEEDGTAMQLHLVMMMHQSLPLWLGPLIWLSHFRGDILENLLETDLRCKLYLSETVYEIHVSGLPRYEYVPIEANLPFVLLPFPFGSSSSLRHVTQLIHGSIHPCARMRLDMRTWTWNLLLYYPCLESILPSN